MCFCNGLNKLQNENENKWQMCTAEAIFCELWPTCLQDPPTLTTIPQTQLQVVHNNKGTPRIRCSQLVHYNQMLQSKTACHAAIWHGEIRLDEIHFKVQTLAYSSIQSAIHKQQAREGILGHEHWHTFRSNPTAALLIFIICQLEIRIV